MYLCLGNQMCSGTKGVFMANAIKNPNQIINWRGRYILKKFKIKLKIYICNYQLIKKIAIGFNDCFTLNYTKKKGICVN